jgi:hypothetical protein
MPWISLVVSLINATFRTPSSQPPTTPAAPPTLHPALRGASLSYASNGRDGRVVFNHPKTSFDLYYEFGGNDVLAIISIPTSEQWTRDTNLPLNLRPATLDFIARQIIRDQTTKPGARFTIEPDSIVIYS